MGRGQEADEDIANNLPSIICRACFSQPATPQASQLEVGEYLDIETQPGVKSAANSHSENSPKGGRIIRLLLAQTPAVSSVLRIVS